MDKSGIYTSKEYVSKIFPARKKDSNKSTYGRVLNIAGSGKYPGAAYLSSMSCLKSGCGYVTLASTKEVCNILSQNAYDLTYMPLNSTLSGSISDENIIDNLKEYNVISIGCGLSTDEETGNFLFSVLKNVTSEQKVIIDADALNIIAKHKDKYIPKKSIITPHPKELSRLLDTDVKEINENREEYAKRSAKQYKSVTVLKGYKTVITDGEKTCINPTGSSALSKAGTGDVLTGIVAAMAAQGLSLFDAAVAGVYLHGLSGEIAARNLTEYSVCASDVLSYIHFAVKNILSEK